MAAAIRTPDRKKDGFDNFAAGEVERRRFDGGPEGARRVSAE